MKPEVVFTSEADAIATDHLLQHYERGRLQEDLCFALWRPSTGHQRRTALIDEIILPETGERSLHGNASLEPAYLARAIRLARDKGTGLAFMHSHPGSGWQGMSTTDAATERDALAYPAGITGLPLVGLTVGRNGYWSARFWERIHKTMQYQWCSKVRVIGPQSYRMYFNDDLMPVPERKDVLRRTFHTWGRNSQGMIARMKVGIVGLGSVGCIVAEAVARIGVREVTLIDPDTIEEHNLDRLIYARHQDVGSLKVDVAARSMREHSTASSIDITQLPLSVHTAAAYQAALDCDIIFSCVDRPVARDVLNYVAQAHLVPVVDGGVAVEFDQRMDMLFSAHWRAHIITPYHQCLRCNGQYNSGMVTTELDGSLDNPSYVTNIPIEERGANQNVLPFSLSLASMEVNLMLRYLLARDWWPLVSQQEYQFITAAINNNTRQCHPNCSFRQRRAQGDACKPFYIMDGHSIASPSQASKSRWSVYRDILVRLAGKVAGRS